MTMAGSGTGIRVFGRVLLGRKKDSVVGLFACRATRTPQWMLMFLQQELIASRPRVGERVCFRRLSCDFPTATKSLFVVQSLRKQPDHAPISRNLIHGTKLRHGCKCARHSGLLHKTLRLRTARIYAARDCRQAPDTLHRVHHRILVLYALCGSQSVCGRCTCCVLSEEHGRTAARRELDNEIEMPSSKCCRAQREPSSVVQQCCHEGQEQNHYHRRGLYADKTTVPNQRLDLSHQIRPESISQSSRLQVLENRRWHGRSRVVV